MDPRGTADLADWQCEALVLAREPRGDSHLRLTLYSQSGGLLPVYRRAAAKAASGGVPDVCDWGEFALERKSGRGQWFVREWTLGQRHAGLGRRPAALAVAGQLALLLVQNAELADALVEQALPLLRRALVALEDTRREPVAVEIKFLYLLARAEGLPVREDWWCSLPPALQGVAEICLTQPADAQPQVAPTLGEVRDHLRHWLHTAADWQT